MLGRPTPQAARQCVAVSRRDGAIGEEDKSAPEALQLAMTSPMAGKINVGLRFDGRRRAFSAPMSRLTAAHCRAPGRGRLEDLNAAFAHHLDHGDIEALVDLFTEDALYTHGERQSVGRAEIERLFRNRIAKGPRTSRHLYSGLRLSIESEREASGISVCLSFAADGLPPLPAKPFLVADFVDRYRLDDGAAGASRSGIFNASSSATR